MDLSWEIYTGRKFIGLKINYKKGEVCKMLISSLKRMKDEEIIAWKEKLEKSVKDSFIGDRTFYHNKAMQLANEEFIHEEQCEEFSKLMLVAMYIGGLSEVRRIMFDINNYYIDFLSNSYIENDKDKK